MTDAPLWFYAAGTEQKGPFTVEQMTTLLAAGVLLPDTLVWTAGMATWLPLAQTPLAPQPGDAGTAPPLPETGAGSPETIIAAVKACFRRYATFSGRARRPEYWYFTLFCMVVSIVLSIVDGALFGQGISPLSSIFSLAVFLPGLAVLVRRLHDTDRTGWLALLGIVPLVGWIVLIVFCCQRGTQGRNRFG